MEGPVWICAAGNEPRWLLRRTQRAFPQARPAELGRVRAGWHVCAGAWTSRPSIPPLLPELDGPCVLLGATLDAARPGWPAADWLLALRAHGGVFDARSPLPPVQSLWLNDAAAEALGSAHSLTDLAQSALARGWRLLRHAALDVGLDARPRLLQVITSLQRGGAERLVLDLHAELLCHGVGAVLLALGSPTRAPFPAPADAVLRRLPPEPAVRAAEIEGVAATHGVDAVHAHLVDGATLAALGPGLPLFVTFHNQRQSWPEQIDQLHARPDAWLIGCSEAVSHEVRQAFPAHVCRTVWNGIQVPDAVAPVPLGNRPLTLVAVANPRPQKRLPLLIEVLAHLPGARLLIAGEASGAHPEAQAEVRRCQELIHAHGLDSAVNWLGAVEDVPAVLAQADVLVSTSAHEGLSLAQLEALAAGVPVVATAVGGAGEIAAAHPGRVRLLPVNATPAEFAKAVREVGDRVPGGGLAPQFTTRAMAGRQAWLLRAGLSRPQQQPAHGLLLVTNNFSTGGAQSSARRLLLKLREMGEQVSAVVLQEDPEDPTPGRRVLMEAGLPVLALVPGEAQRALLPLLDHIAHHPPEAVVFWNVIPEHKVLLADALPDTRVFDVSPGEMLFASLQRYFCYPRPGLPYHSALEYGQRLTGVIVKHAEEVALAEETFQRPVALIPNGVLARRFSQEAPEARWVLGTAARIHPHKRLEDLLAAFRLVHLQLPHTRLRIAGGADAGQEAYAAALRETVADLPVVWCGEIQDMGAFHDTLSVFAMISEPSGCPNASLEAMASSLPVVATQVGGAIQQIEHGLTGLLTPPRDPAAMAAALLRLLQDNTLRASMRTAAHARVHTVFSLGQMAANYCHVCLGRSILIPTV